MHSKSLLIAIAAFAVTASGVHAYVGNKHLNKAGFSQHQIEALAEARELKSQGEVEKARDLLLKVGVDEKKLEALRKISHKSHRELHEAVENSDFEGFRKAIVGTPLEDIVVTEDDFKLFKEAHDLRQSGNLTEAKVIFDELGISDHKKHGHGHYQKKYKNDWLQLSVEQRDALRVARQANDNETIEIILGEAGIDITHKKKLRNRIYY